MFKKKTAYRTGRGARSGAPQLLKIALLALTWAASGCGTIVQGKLTDCQRVKGPGRQINVPILVADILMAPVALPIDFATHKVYKKNCVKTEK